MKYGNLVSEEHANLSNIEISKVRNLVPEGFNIYDIKINEDPLFGTYFYFKFIPSKCEYKLSDKSSVKFNVDKNGYCKGYFNISKATKGILEDREKSFENGSYELIGDKWEGIQYSRSIHVDTKMREFRCKTWTTPIISQLLEDNSISSYSYDTELENLQISEIFEGLLKKYLLN